MSININGKSYAGRNIVISNGKVIIDGKDQTPEGKEINISVDGNVNRLEVDYADRIDIKGDVAIADCKNGNLSCRDIVGDAETKNGNIVCSGKIEGNATTKNGNIIHK